MSIPNNKNHLKKVLSKVKNAFKSFNKIELNGRQYIQDAIIGCFNIYLHYDEKFIKKRCRKAGIKYKVKKPMKMILMLAMSVSDDCDDERVKARIRTYVRVLKRFDSLNYDIKTAEENLSKYGIDYFANCRSKNEDEEDEKEVDESEKQLELPFDDGDDYTEEETDYEEEDEGDEDEEDYEDENEGDNNDAVNDVKNLPSASKNQSLSAKTVTFFQANNIKDKNYVIWVNENNVYKSSDSILLQSLNVSSFTKL